MKKVLGSVLFVSTLASLTAACSRNSIEAVNLANEGDGLRATSLDSAISKYEQAANLDPSNHRIFGKLAAAYQKKDQWDRVATACAKAEKLAPKHANYFFLHGHALMEQAKKGGPTSWAEAREPLEQAIKLDPNLADAHFDLAEVLLNLDDESGAIASYTNAIMKKPDALIFYATLADLYIRLNRLDEAEQVLTQAVPFGKDGDKGLFNVHSLLGEIYERKREPTKAIAAYESAKKACGPCNEAGQTIAFFNLGVAYASLNPPKKSDAIGNLQSFHKMTCKGAAAQRYADQCSQAQQRAAELGSPLQ